MMQRSAPDVSVKALNLDNRREVENVCELFRACGHLIGYPQGLSLPRTWNAVHNRGLVSLITGSANETIGHLGLRTRRSFKNESSLELVLPLGDVSNAVSSLQHYRTLNAARSVSYLGSKHIFEMGGFARLKLVASAQLVLTKTDWVYACTPNTDLSGKAMAVFLPDSIAKDCQDQFAALGLLRKRKSAGQSASWAVQADMPAVAAIDRSAGAYSVQPSLLMYRHFSFADANCLLINIFDPAAEELATNLLREGFHYSGIAPRLAGIDYLVLTRINATKNSSITKDLRHGRHLANH